jgi:hypothetical protein
MKMNNLIKLKSLKTCLLIAAILFSVYNTQAQHNVLTEKEMKEGWRLLFDGKTLNGWRSFKEKGVSGWKVEDGTLMALGVGSDPDGDIITEETFESFELILDWKISQGGNSGIFFHVIESDDFNTIYETGPEYQLFDDLSRGKGSLGMNGVSGNYGMHAPKNPAIKKAGEWNTTRIVVNKGAVEHWLNGKKVLNYQLGSNEWNHLVQNGKWKEYPFYGKAGRGHIALQDHGYKIWFRNVKLKPLAVTSLFNGKDLSGWKIHGTEKWYVQNGELVCESGPDKAYGYLATVNDYKNFELTIEFLQEADGNSGIFFRSNLDGTKISGWQVEVAPPDKDTGGIYESYGRGWLQKIPDEKEDVLQMGKWNHMKIIVKDDHVQSFLNGVKMADLQDEKIGEANGKIALQIHDGGGIKVRWRNININELK